MTSPLEPRDRPPKRRGALLRLYDVPPHRDWLLWWTAGWTITAGLAIGFPVEGEPRTSSLPVWLDASLAALFFGATLGLLPAYIRLLWRRHRVRRAHGRAPSPEESSTKVASVDQASDLRTETPEARRSKDDQGHRAKSSAPSARAPLPIGALDLSEVRESIQLQDARDSLPYPIARAARATQLATDARELYEATLRAAEVVSIVTGVTATAWARAYKVDTRELQQLQDAFVSRGVSQGLWHDVARSIEPTMATHEQAIPGMVEGVRRAREDRVC